MIANRKHNRRRGAGLIVALVTLLVITLMTGTIVRLLLVHVRQTRLTAADLQAAWLADAAVERAIVKFRENPSYEREDWRAAAGSMDDAEHVGMAEIRITKTEAGGARITVEARYPDDPTRRALERRAVTVSKINSSAKTGASPQ